MLNTFIEIKCLDIQTGESQISVRICQRMSEKDEVKDLFIFLVGGRIYGLTLSWREVFQILASFQF